MNDEPKRNPCEGNACGPYSQCRVINGQSTCACLPEYIGVPPNCRPECILNADCDPSKACSNNRCIDPCQPGTCAITARCQVINHSAICSCPPSYTGDPLIRCIKKTVEPNIYRDPNPRPCIPTPCGPYSECREINKQAVCSCVQNYIGTPPLCRPECTSNSECAFSSSCINFRCVDPCAVENICGSHTNCKVYNHHVSCFCEPQFTGDPFTGCIPIPSTFQANHFKLKLMIAS